MCAHAGICSCMQTYTKVRETGSGAEQKIRTLLHGRVSAFHHFALLQSSELPKCIKKATKKKKSSPCFHCLYQELQKVLISTLNV